MSWFEVAAVPSERFSKIFEKVKFFIYANSDKSLADKSKKYTDKLCKRYLRELFYKYYLTEFSEDRVKLEESLRIIENMKILISSMGFSTNVEDVTLKEMANTAFSNAYTVISAKCASSCEGCRNDRPDQKSHMIEGGCLSEN